MAKLNELLVAGPAKFLETVQGTVTSANKITTDAGSSTCPVYFSGGVPVEISSLAVSYGGTGTTTLASGKVLIGNGTGAIQTRSIVDSSSASAIGTSASIPTERDIYYGLPTINGSHEYTISTTLFAPTSAGTSGYILKSGGSGAPSWVAQSSIAAGSATTSTRPSGFSGQKSSWTWGTTTTANGYTQLTDWTYNGGEICFSEKGGQVFCQLDGFFYQREGGSRCLDTSDLLTATYIKVRSSSYTSSTAGEIWIVA